MEGTGAAARQEGCPAALDVMDAEAAVVMDQCLCVRIKIRIRSSPKANQAAIIRVSGNRLKLPRVVMGPKCNGRGAIFES